MCLSAYLSMYLSICLSIYLSITYSMPVQSPLSQICAGVCNIRPFLILVMSAPDEEKQGELLTTRKSYSTLVWMITHTYFTAFSCYHSRIEHNSRHMTYIAHETSIFCNPPIQSFTADRKSLTDELKQVT